MSYSGAEQEKVARENLGKALASLQSDGDIPEEVATVAENIARAVSALFEAEAASTEPDGKAGVKSALGSLTQTLALLQDVKGNHAAVADAATAISQCMAVLFPLTMVPSRMPPAAETQASSDADHTTEEEEEALLEDENDNATNQEEIFIENKEINESSEQSSNIENLNEDENEIGESNEEELNENNSQEA